MMRGCACLFGSPSNLSDPASIAGSLGAYRAWCWLSALQGCWNGPLHRTGHTGWAHRCPRLTGLADVERKSISNMGTGCGICVCQESYKRQQHSHFSDQGGQQVRPVYDGVPRQTSNIKGPAVAGAQWVHSRRLPATPVALFRAC